MPSFNVYCPAVKTYSDEFLLQVSHDLKTCKTNKAIYQFTKDYMQERQILRACKKVK